MTGATAGVATLPSSRRRRDSSEDFGAAGSLGSIGGSEVGSSVHSESGAVVAAAAAAATPTIVATAATISTTASVVAATTPHTTSQHDSLFTTPAKAAPSTASEGKAEAASSSSPGSEDRKSMPAPPPVAFITTPKKVPPLGATQQQQQQQQEKTPQVKNTSASKSKKSNLKSEGTISDEHRPFRKRKNSVDFDLDESHHQYPGTNLTKQTIEALPSIDALPFDDLLSHKAGRSDSFASFGGSGSSVTRLRSDTLERLDALGEEAKLAAAKIRTTRKDSQATTSSSGGGSQHTLTSTTHRLLLQAFMGGADPDDEDDEDDDDEMVGDADDDEMDAAMAAAEGDGGDDESLVDSHAAEQAETQEMTRENNERRDRLGSFDVARERLGSFDVRERLGSFDARDRLGSFDVRDRLGSFDVRDRADSFGGRERLGSFDGTTTHVPSYETLRRRERLESWGGMSDLSIPQVPDSTGDSLIGIGSGAGGGGSAGGNTNSTSALAAAVYTSLANDLSAAANMDGEESINDFFVGNENVPSKISTTRDRLDSINSAATDPSISQLPTEEQIPSDIQKFVKQAMASVGDQLAGIAMAATEATKDLEDQSELSSTASPMIGAVADAAAKSIYQSRSKLTLGMDIAVDYSAVQAAVNAAEAAAGAIDLTVFAQSASASVASNSSSTINKMPAAGGTKRKRTTLPTKKSKTPKTPTSTSKKIPKDAAKVGAKAAAKASSKAVPKTATKGTPVVVKATPKPPIELPPIPKSKMDERDMELLRERARAAAGYVPPSKQPGGRPPAPPPKKRKIEPQTPHVRNTPTLYTTPRTIYSDKKVISTPYTPASSYMSTPASAKSTASKGQSTQKWDAMYECLLEFVEERRAEATKGMTEAEKKEWIWDGNVPTTHKTKDGKALGRWVNNQRSAKSKGALKDEREKRLVDAGLKWSVLASNSWNEMLAELRIYVNEQIKAGRKWDGNGKIAPIWLFDKLLFSFLSQNDFSLSFAVPTNYRIKTKPGMAARDDDEDKNLGRWVNRQRSLYQAGKLRKDRQLALEKVGLKWSMLATTSWESMFDTLVEYVEEKVRAMWVIFAEN